MLTVRDLVKVYPGPVTALQGVSLDLPNGAGKTTFMRILAGLLEPTSGRVTLDGADVLRRATRPWRGCGRSSNSTASTPTIRYCRTSSS